MLRVVLSVIVVLSCIAVSFHAKPASADDWPQFLGPNRDAKAASSATITPWSKGGPKVLWTADTGPGFGGASIVDGKVFILDRVSDEGDVLRVFDLRSGNELWKYAYDAEGTARFHGSRSTPTIDGDMIFTVGMKGNVHCISRKTRKAVWKKNLSTDWKAGDLKWDYAQSPLVFKDKVILTPTSGETPVLVALNKATGDVVWSAEKPNLSDKYNADYYASPNLRTVCGVTGVMQITNNEVTFVNPENGRTIWKYTGYDIKFAIPSPTVLPATDGGNSNMIFITGGYDDGSVMIKVVKDFSGYKIEELWRPNTKGIPDGCQVHPAIYHDGYLYANINENSKFSRRNRERGGLACLDPKTGKILWRTGGDPFFSRGSVILVGKHLVIQEGEEGTIHLIDPNPKAYKELARAKVLQANGGKAWAPLAFADGVLICRDQNQMKAVQLGKQLSAK